MEHFFLQLQVNEHIRPAEGSTHPLYLHWSWSPTGCEFKSQNYQKEHSNTFSSLDLSDKWIFMKWRDKSLSPHLSILQRVDFRVKWCTDDFIIVFICWWSSSWDDIEACDAFRIRDGVILPRHEGFSIQRSFQDPVSGPWRVGSL